jgi:hypothetical protein
MTSNHPYPFPHESGFDNKKEKGKRKKEKRKRTKRKKSDVVSE